MRRQLAGQGLDLGLSPDSSSPQLYFDVLRELGCPPVELRVEIVVAEEACQFGAIYKKKRHCMLSYYLPGSYMDLL